ncbi:MAG TPA: sigma 54-interacting transcriptional regulator [Plasticicumulans sp.]|nr:sigma 54-interacting transcriptional regulator [Plasticicumulans sp.]
MRLQIVFDDRVGIAMAVLNSLARHNINMTAGDIVTQNDGRGSFYLHAAQMTLDELHRVLPEIRQVPGVRDVRPIPLMPGERKQSELRTLLGALPAPVLSLDLEGRVVVANESAQRLLKLKGPDGQGTPLAPLVEDFDLVEHINRLDRPEYGVRLALRGQAVLADFIPVLVPLARAGKSLSGAVMVLHGGSLEVASPAVDAGFASIVHRSAPMRALVAQARRMAPLSAPILILGESGSGKARLAYACHLASPRREAPFLRLNAGELADAGAEAVLFGVREQPGLFEQGAGGTLFLSDVAELSPALQARLLGFLQDGRFRRGGSVEPRRADVRIIASTRVDLAAEVRDGRFRDDLYYHLHVLNLQMPSLRERQADVLPVALEAIEMAARQLACAPPRLTPEAEAALLAHGWPGNVRQLENTLLRAVTVAEGGAITPELLALGTDATAASGAPIDEALFEGSLAEALARVERLMLARLYPSHPSTRQLARRLGLSHTAVANKLRQYGIGLGPGSGPAAEPRRG